MRRATGQIGPLCVAVCAIACGQQANETAHPACRHGGSGTWTELPTPMAGISHDAGVAFGDGHMVVWGTDPKSSGVAPACLTMDDCALTPGMRFDVATGAWEPTGQEYSPTPRSDVGAAPAGDRVVFWGGEAGGFFGDGGFYDPVADTWELIPAADPQLAPLDRFQPTIVWTGDFLLVWSGWNFVDGDAQGRAPGLVYDPAAGTWRAMSVDGAPNAGSASKDAVVWTGAELIVWGGENPADRHAKTGTGAAYDPVNDRWRALPLEGAPQARLHPVSAWTGTDFLVFGGISRDTHADIYSGAAYNPETDTWRDLAPLDRPLWGPRMGAWTGSELMVWSRDDSCFGGAFYDPRSDTWRPMAMEGAPYAMWQYLFWTGDGVLFFEDNTGFGVQPTVALYRE